MKNFIDKHTEYGFTMVEVTLAIALFGLTMVVITQAFVNTLVSLDSIESEADVQSDIRFVRALALEESDLDEFEQGGNVETLSSGTASWQATVEETRVSDLFSVQLTIELTPPGDTGRVTFNQDIMVLRPTWSDPVERSELIAEARERLLETRQHNEFR